VSSVRGRCLTFFFIIVFVFLFDFLFLASEQGTDMKRYAGGYAGGGATIATPSSSLSTVALCLMVKDDMDIYEWITYHNRLGVGKFYIFDNGSSPPLKTSLKSLIDANLVYYEYTYGDDRWLHVFVNKYLFKWRDAKVNKQVFIYNKCKDSFGHLHQWMGFFDTDEFVVIEKTPEEIKQNKHVNIALVLQEYVDFAGLKLPWVLFGSSGRVSRPEFGVLGTSGNYTKCCAVTCRSAILVKAFVQPKYATVSHIHDFLYKEPWFSVMPTKKQSADSGAWEDQYKRIWLNHYSIKSQQDYHLKMKRGAGNDVHRGVEYFDTVNNITRETCPLLYMPPLHPLPT